MSDVNTINNDETMNGAARALLAGRYRVVRQLGQGGMGSVWLAEDTKLDGFKVAIKMLPSVLVNNKRAYAQVKTEALVSLKLSHPNIATVRAFEEECGSPFLVMDYIDGQTLDDYLAEKGNLSEEETVRLLKPVAAALDYAHSQGVVHRDVKPGNVMIDKSGHPYVLDFGIAREVQETMTRVTGKLSSGTLMYMSPEQLHGAAPKSAQDVYSFAAMVYECLKGEPPFSRGQIEYQIEHDAPEPLSRHIAICRGVMAGLGKTPEARPSTCAAVLENDGKRAAKTGAGASAGRTRIAAVVLGVLALGAFVGIGWWWQERAKSEGQRVKNVALAAERARKAEDTKTAEEKSVAEENRLVEEKHKAEGPKVVAAKASENEDRRRQEETVKLATTRTKIAIKIAAAKDDYAKVAPYRSERDGFESHLAEIDRQWEVVKGILNPKTLTEAEKTLVAVSEAADAIAFELNWLKTNRDGRDAAKRMEKEIVGELEAKLREFKADDVAKTKYDKGQGERRSAAAALARGEFTSAQRQYETAKATLSAALTDARQFHVKTALAVANEYKTAAQWQKCSDEAAKVLDWEAQNSEALALKKEAESHLGPKAGEVRTIMLPGGAEMEMVWCPPGSFMMGSPETEDDRGSNETWHRVALTQGFWMGKYEVTQAQWESVMGKNPSRFKGADRPVEWVSWDDCQAFIRKVNSSGQVTVALPTEAQWEYACRAGTTTPFSFGQSLNGDGANCDGNYPYGTTVKGAHRKETASVGSYAPNAWGLYDMHGNVLEWCMDRYGKYDDDAMNPLGSVSGVYRVARGGCWDNPALLCRSSNRSRYVPALRDFYLGFRLVCLSEERR